DPVLSCHSRRAGTTAPLEEVNKKLPPELLREVDQVADWPMDLEEAKRHRANANLTVERCYISETFNTNLFELPSASAST
ncbi:hypothetical protein EC957_006897, partial [Mortierella hygrophila]